MAGPRSTEADGSARKTSTDGSACSPFSRSSGPEGSPRQIPPATSEEADEAAAATLTAVDARVAAAHAGGGAAGGPEQASGRGSEARQGPEGSVSINLEASSSTDPAKRTDDVLWYDPHLPRITI